MLILFLNFDLAKVEETSSSIVPCLRPRLKNVSDQIRAQNVEQLLIIGRLFSFSSS